MHPFSDSDSADSEHGIRFKTDSTRKQKDSSHRKSSHHSSSSRRTDRPSRSGGNHSGRRDRSVSRNRGRRHSRSRSHRSKSAERRRRRSRDRKSKSRDRNSKSRDRNSKSRDVSSRSRDARDRNSRSRDLMSKSRERRKSWSKERRENKSKTRDYNSRRSHRRSKEKLVELNNSESKFDRCDRSKTSSDDDEEEEDACKTAVSDEEDEATKIEERKKHKKKDKHKDKDEKRRKKEEKKRKSDLEIPKINNEENGALELPMQKKIKTIGPPISSALTLHSPEIIGPSPPDTTVSSIVDVESSKVEIIGPLPPSSTMKIIGPSPPETIVSRLEYAALKTPSELPKENEPSGINSSPEPETTSTTQEPKPAQETISTIEEPKSPDAYGPLLPPTLKPAETSPQERYIGPSLPDSIREQLQNQPFLEAAASEEEEDSYGPMPVDVQPKTSAHVALEERALQMKLDKLGGGSEVKAGREEWMIELPAAAGRIGLGARQFRAKEGPDMSDRSSWTDTPNSNADPDSKQPKQKPVDLKREAELVEARKYDDEQEKMIKDHKKKKKKERSLLEQHQDKIKQKKAETEQEGGSARRPFSRDVDLKVNRFDEAQKKAIYKKAQLLDDRFSKGQSKFL